MSGPSAKRKNPFGDEQYLAGRPTKQPKEDTDFIYERTLARLMSNKDRQINKSGSISHVSTIPDSPSSTASVDAPEMLWSDLDRTSCYVCHRVQGTIACFFCETLCCEGCTVQCEKCSNLFCQFCSTVNYDLRYDRTFCLNCNQEEQAQMKRQKPSNSALMATGGLVPTAGQGFSSWDATASNMYMPSSDALIVDAGDDMMVD